MRNLMEVLHGFMTRSQWVSRWCWEKICRLTDIERKSNLLMTESRWRWRERESQLWSKESNFGHTSFPFTYFTIFLLFQAIKTMMIRLLRKSLSCNFLSSQDNPGDGDEEKTTCLPLMMAKIEGRTWRSSQSGLKRWLPHEVKEKRLENESKKKSRKKDWLLEKDLKEETFWRSCCCSNILIHVLLFSVSSSKMLLFESRPHHFSWLIHLLREYIDQEDKKSESQARGRLRRSRDLKQVT